MLVRNKPIAGIKPGPQLEIWRYAGSRCLGTAVLSKEQMATARNSPRYKLTNAAALPPTQG